MMAATVRTTTMFRASVESGTVPLINLQLAASPDSSCQRKKKIFALICIIIDLFYQGLLAVQFLELLNSSASGAKRDSGTKVNAALAIDPNIQGDSIIYFQRSNFRFILVFYSVLWVGCLSCFEKIFRSYEFIPVKGESTDSTFKT